MNCALISYGVPVIANKWQEMTFWPKPRWPIYIWHCVQSWKSEMTLGSGSTNAWHRAHGTLCTTGFSYWKFPNTTRNQNIHKKIVVSPDTDRSSWSYDAPLQNQPQQFSLSPTLQCHTSGSKSRLLVFNATQGTSPVNHTCDKQTQEWTKQWNWTSL